MRFPSLAAGIALALVAAGAAAQIPPATPEFQVNGFTTADQFSYSAQLDRDGHFLVTWDSDGEDAATWTAVARVFDPNEAPLTGDLQVNTYTTGIQDFARASMDGSGRFVVVWSSDGQDGSDYGVFARRYDRDGAGASRPSTWCNDIGCGRRRPSTGYITRIYENV